MCGFKSRLAYFGRVAQRLRQLPAKEHRGNPAEVRVLPRPLCRADPGRVRFPLPPCRLGSGRAVLALQDLETWHEWIKAPVPKTGGCHSPVGSNPTVSSHMTEAVPRGRSGYRLKTARRPSTASGGARPITACSQKHTHSHL